MTAAFSTAASTFAGTDADAQTRTRGAEGGGGKVRRRSQHATRLIGANKGKSSSGRVGARAHLRAGEAAALRTATRLGAAMVRTETAETVMAAMASCSSLREVASNLAAVAERRISSRDLHWVDLNQWNAAF